MLVLTATSDLIFPFVSSLLFHACPVLSRANDLVSALWTKLPVTSYLKSTFFTHYYAG